MTNEQGIRFCDEYFARNISDIDKEFLKIAKEALQQEPKTGHWIDHEKHIECDSCSVWFLKDHLIRKSFCPNCGAKMSEMPTGSEGSDKE